MEAPARKKKGKKGKAKKGPPRQSVREETELEDTDLSLGQGPPQEEGPPPYQEAASKGADAAGSADAAGEASTSAQLEETSAPVKENLGSRASVNNTATPSLAEKQPSDEVTDAAHEEAGTSVLESETAVDGEQVQQDAEKAGEDGSQLRQGEENPEVTIEDSPLEEVSGSTKDVKESASGSVEATSAEKEMPLRSYEGADDIVSLPEEEFHYEPPQNDSLPNLDALLDTLDGGESDLETETEPPHLFQRPEQEPNYQEISNLRSTLEAESIDPYVDRFDDSIRDEVLMIGNISLEEVQEEERRLRDEHIAYQHQEMLIARQRQEAILTKEEKAKQHVMKVMKEKRKDLARREELSLQRERLLQNKLHHSFKRAENQLKRSLAKRKGEIKTMYGDLMMADGEYGGSKGRRWKVDWNKSPQPIQIKLKCLRGVKDKLPSGRYVLMVSLYDRLGGHVLRWSRLRGQEWGGATLPLSHDGNFFNVEINIEQSVFTVLPAKPQIRPGMVLLFELFLLRGTLLPVDKVVSWGVFPICDGQFEVLQGRYKTPMLRGEFDPRIEKHEVVEKLMASDLDHWMCNMYFEIIKLPRYIAGQKEYEVELQFSSQLMSFPDRVKGAEEAVDGEQPIPGSSMSVDSAGEKLKTSEQNLQGSSQSLQEKKQLEETTEENPSSSSESIAKKGSVLSESNETLKKAESDDKVDTISNKEQDGGDGVRFRGVNQPPTVIGSRKMMRKSEKAYLSDSGSESDDEMLMKKDDGFRVVKGEPGLYYKQHTNPTATEYMRQLYTMLPKTALLNQKKKRKKLTHLEELDTHSFAVQQPFSTKGHLERKGHEKIQYVSRQILSEMGLSQWRSREFWTLVLLLCLIFFIRMYLHYIGQWAFLNIIGIPVSSFDFYPYTVSLNYQSSLLHTREEVAVVIFGPATNVFILILLVLACWITQKTVGNFPDLFCKFIMVYAILTFLDPILIAIVDAPLGRYDFEVGDEPIADAAKLYYHFYRIHNNGLMGILLTVPIYLCLMFLTFVIFYMYFLRLHNNGRMLDIFHRLHAPEDDFFTPYDLEISNQELAYICKKAEQWRGEEGERRKVAVYDYIWKEEEDEEYDDDEEDKEKKMKPSHEEITTHVSIHTLHLDGLKELYRHFLKLPDGAVVEVFGEMGVSGIDKDLKAALQNQTQGLGKVAESKESIKVENNSKLRPKTVGGFGPKDFLDIPGSPSVSARNIPSVSNSQASLAEEV
ncbi:hypothetical protein HOLleu_40259 [Holothuria leucospilota]|uniref:Uncharacterized protein n=1 Tax=Holothuria leucospilota TaxID=206669 RepID=A0A9Q0YFJ1_HOLLE|nr:hypothetical protein HOLleu_40259 [Holothuria leucospilota]